MSQVSKRILAALLALPLTQSRWVESKSAAPKKEEVSADEVTMGLFTEMCKSLACGVFDMEDIARRYVGKHIEWNERLPWTFHLTRKEQKRLPVQRAWLSLSQDELESAKIATQRMDSQVVRCVTNSMSGNSTLMDLSPLERSFPIALCSWSWKDNNSILWASEIECCLTHPNNKVREAVRVFHMGVNTAIRTGDPEKVLKSSFKFTVSDDMRRALMNSQTKLTGTSSNKMAQSIQCIFHHMLNFGPDDTIEDKWSLWCKSGLPQARLIAVLVAACHGLRVWKDQWQPDVNPDIQAWLPIFKGMLKVPEAHIVHLRM